MKHAVRWRGGINLPNGRVQHLGVSAAGHPQISLLSPSALRVCNCEPWLIGSALFDPQTGTSISMRRSAR